MSRYRLTLAALADLEEIHGFVADDADEAMAKRVIAEIMTEIERLAEMDTIAPIQLSPRRQG